MTTPDVDFVDLIVRIADIVGDTDVDPDDNPDLAWIVSGTVEVSPLNDEGYTLVPDGPLVGVRRIALTFGNDGDGYARWQGKTWARMVDLTSEKINPRVQANQATHKVEFNNLRTLDGTEVRFKTRYVRLAADTLEVADDGTGTMRPVCRLSRLYPLPFATPSPIYQGPRGEKGDTGDTGATGPAGGVNKVAGLQGDVGAQQLVDAIATPFDARIPVVGDVRYARLGQVTKNDSAAGMIDWLNSSPTTGYLLHLRSWAGSGAGTAAVGIGTDQGNGAGLLISHKNTARGLTLSAQPGAGIGAYLTGRTTNPLLYLELNPGSGPVVYQSGTGAGFADGTTTSGSTTFTSNTAAFTAADVGKSLTQLTSRGLATDPSGCIPAGTTIASVESATSITMSQAAQATGSTVLFAVGSRTKPVGESLWESRDEASAVLAKLTKAGLNLKGGDAATAALKVTGATGASTNIFEALIAANGTPAFNITQSGQMQASFTSTLTNAGATGAPAATAFTYSSHPSVALTRSSGAVGDMIQARGSGTTPLSRINKDGFIITAKNAAPADADLNAGEIAFWFDSTNGAAKLKVKAKEAGGTVRTGEVALA